MNKFSTLNKLRENIAKLQRERFENPRGHRAGLCLAMLKGILKRILNGILKGMLKGILKAILKGILKGILKAILKAKQ